MEEKAGAGATETAERREDCALELEEPDGRRQGGGAERDVFSQKGAALALLVTAAAAAANVFLAAPSLERALFFLPVVIPIFYQRSSAAAVAVAAGGVAAAAASEAAAAAWGVRPFDLSLVAAVTLILASSVAGGLLLRRRLQEDTRDLLVDERTGLPGPRMVELVLRKDLAAARRGQSLTVAMLSMDGVDEENGRCDRSVHLGRVAEVLRTSVRDMDFVGRVGTASFLAVIRHESSNGVSVLADRLRARVEELSAGEEPACTVSVGIVTFDPEMSGPAELLHRVRETVDRAQELGGNRVLVARRQGFREGPRTPSFPAHLRVM